MTDDELPIIDAHHHFWELGHGRHPWLEDHVVPFRYGDYSAIRKSYLIDDFRRDHGAHNVVKSVHMEAEWDPRDPVAETRWLHELHDRTGWPHAVVGQAWFTRPDIATVLAGHAAFPLIRSVRQKPTAAPSPDAALAGAPGSMADPAFRAGYRLLAKHGLHYDLQTPWWHLGEAADLARDFPDTLIVLNHTGLPSDRSTAGLAGWRAGMAAFADQPNTAVKISGIGVPGRAWTPDLQGGVVLETIRLFGADRCMVASNFPVDSICASYDEIFSGLKAITAMLPLSERQAIFHDTAMRIYRPV
ncbi:putative hydrolase [alpha proteobacterium BAL199]|nr:putative hydrolase [alpha proteobacterium BAL199]